MIKISKIFGDFVPRDSSLAQGLLPSIRHFENRRGEGPGDEVATQPFLFKIQNNINQRSALSVKLSKTETYFCTGKLQPRDKRKCEILAKFEALKHDLILDSYGFFFVKLLFYI